jgi:oligopeptide/dipeptide ABC transporter ATP-binding protein
MAEMVKNATEKNALLQVDDIKVYFPIKAGFFSRVKGYVQAVDGVSFDLYPGETFALVGESGCGKSTTARAILRLVPLMHGKVTFENEDLYIMNKARLKEKRKDMQMIFQDPYASLDPRRTVGSIIGEALSIHKISSGRERLERIHELMDLVGLRPEYISRFPHQFSGGQRQRIGIARALALNPKLIICDEPLSALDVSIQAQILNLLDDLKNKLGMAYLFITHDLAVVKHVSDRIAVMYLGHIVEYASTADLFNDPLHPYTRGLLASIPIPDPESNRKRNIIMGDIPSPSSPPPGCKFHTRCQEAQGICSEETPPLVELKPGHYCRCHREQAHREQRTNTRPATM